MERDYASECELADYVHGDDPHDGDAIRFTAEGDPILQHYDPFYEEPNHE